MHRMAFQHALIVADLVFAVLQESVSKPTGCCVNPSSDHSVTKLRKSAFEVKFTQLRPYATQKRQRVSGTSVEVTTVPKKG